MPHASRPYRRIYRGAANEVRAPAEFTVQLIMSCQHTRMFSRPVPKVGAELMCLRCNAARMVTAHMPEMRARCTVCRYSRGFGQAQLAAETSGVKHAVKHRHRVEVQLGSEVLAVFGADHPDQLMLDDEPPF